jgi:hypothetical protein
MLSNNKRPTELEMKPKPKIESRLSTTDKPRKLRRPRLDTIRKLLRRKH